MRQSSQLLLALSFFTALFFVLLAYRYDSVIHTPAESEESFPRPEDSNTAPLSSQSNQQASQQQPQTPQSQQQQDQSQPQPHRELRALPPSASVRSDHGHTEAYKRLIEQSAFDSSAMEETVWGPYRALHHKIRTQVPPENQRFAVYECSSGPCGGFGDRIMGMIGVVWLGIVTDRAFLVNWVKSWPLTKFFASSIDWEYTPGVVQRPSAQNWIDRSPHDLSPFESHNNLRVTVNTGHLFDPLFRDSMAQSRNAKLGFPRNERHVFQLLANFLFKPQPVLQEVMDSFKARNNWIQSRTRVIGIQVRTGTGLGESRRNRVEVSEFFEIAKQVEKYFFRPTDNVRWFLTTDDAKLEESAKAEYGEKVMILEGKISHTDMSRGSEAEAGGLKTVADWWLLSETDMLVISCSMFGWTAAWHFGKPYVLMPYCTQASNLTLPQDVLADPPFPVPPVCNKRPHEPCRQPYSPSPTEWTIGATYA